MLIFVDVHIAAFGVVYSYYKKFAQIGCRQHNHFLYSAAYGSFIYWGVRYYIAHFILFGGLSQPQTTPPPKRLFLSFALFFFSSLSVHSYIPVLTYMYPRWPAIININIFSLLFVKKNLMHFSRIYTFSFISFYSISPCRSNFFLVSVM